MHGVHSVISEISHKLTRSQTICPHLMMTLFSSAGAHYLQLEIIKLFPTSTSSVSPGFPPFSGFQDSGQYNPELLTYGHFVSFRKIWIHLPLDLIGFHELPLFGFTFGGPTFFG